MQHSLWHFLAGTALLVPMRWLHKMIVAAKPVELVDKGQGVFRQFEWLSLAIGLVTAALVLGLSGFGYDLTDEGYYLSSIAHHAEFSVSSTQFGFVYHPLYRLVGGDIALLRASNLAITVLLGICLTRMVLCCRLPTSIAIGTTSVLVINGWLVSPNYNSLVIQAALLAAIGLCWSFRSPASDCPPVLIGLAGWLAFMAKPPSAAALAVLTLLCLALVSNLRVRPLLIAVLVATLALVFSSIAIDGSPLDFFARLSSAVEDRRVLVALGSVEAIFRIDPWPLAWTDKALLLTMSGLVAIATALITSLQPTRQRLALSLVAFGGVLCAVAMIVFRAELWPELVQRQAVWRILPFAAAAGAIIGTVFGRWGTIGRAMRSEDWATIIYLGAIPFVTAFGSNVNYWLQGGCASIFWTLAGLRFVMVVSGRIAQLPTILVTQANCLLLVIVWVTHPYRQSQSLFEQQGVASVGAGELRMSKDGAKYLDTIMVEAKRNGFRSGDPLLDLTGRSPGVAFALGAFPVADPWILGGYVGSQNFARRIVARTSCAIIGRAWLLVETGGPRAIDPALVGMSPSGFRVVARLPGPATDYRVGRAQILMRPNGKVAARVAACERTRSADMRKKVK